MRDRRVDTGHRPEGAGRHREEPLHAKLRLQHHGEATVVRRRGPRGHPGDDLLLQHHVEVRELCPQLGQPEEQRRADVVRQIADDAQRRPQHGIVEFERIRDMEREALRREFRREPRGEVAVDLDRMDAAGAFDERPGQRAESGADLDEIVAAPRVDGVDDPRDVMRIGEEILAEPLARLVALHPVSVGRRHRRSHVRSPG